MGNASRSSGSRLAGGSSPTCSLSGADRRNLTGVDPRNAAPTTGSRSARSIPPTTWRVGPGGAPRAARASGPTPGASTRPCTGAGRGPCASTPASADAETTNQRWKMLLASGSTGLSCAFDLPTQMGYDSDHPRAEGEVGRVGVAIDSVEDMHRLLAGLPLDQVTTSMTINATAAILLLLYQLVAEEAGVAAAGAGRHHPERHLEGVHRPGHLHLPAPAVDAAGHRHLRLLPRRTCRRGTPSPSPATTSARPARRRSRRSPSPWPTASPTSRRPWRRGWRWTSSRRG